MNDFDFLRAIQDAPHDPTPRLVYADWLDELGDPRGELLRIQEELRHLDVFQRIKKESRMKQLLRAGVEPLMITRTSSLGMQEVLIFPGEFVMGNLETQEDRFWLAPSDSEGINDFCNAPPVKVRLTQSFWLGKHAVTQAEWQQLMGSQPWEGEEVIRDDPACPATDVSWEDAIDFCRKLTEQERQVGLLPKEWKYTLPTEAQWEYVCRAGTTPRCTSGNHASGLGIWSSYFQLVGDVVRWDHKVGLRWPNPWGVYDMHGNLGEWCLDVYQEWLLGGVDLVRTTEDANRVLRGGGWDYFSGYCQPPIRLAGTPSSRMYQLGFRVARVLSSESA